MRLIELLYRSPAGRLLSLPLRLLGRLHRPFMMYGFKDPATGAFRKFVRISSSASILGSHGLSLADHIWVGHNTVLDATGGLEIGEGCQIGVGVGIFTHGSHNAIRLLGRSYVDIPAHARRGYVRKPIRIGPYTFVGTGAFIMPGVTIGRGCIIGPNCVVMTDVPDFAVLAAAPSRVIGSTLDSDTEAFRQHDFGPTYFEPLLAPSLRRGDYPDPASLPTPTTKSTPPRPIDGPRVDVVTSVGGGVFGEDLTHELRRQGVDSRLVFSVPLDAYRSAKANRNMRWLRFRTYILFPTRVFLAALFGSRRTFVVTSNPFFLPWLVALAARLRGHRVIHWLYDLYPDALVVGGALRPGTPTEHLIGWWMKHTLRACDLTVFLGDHLREYAESKYGRARAHAVIPVGSDGRLFPPASLPAPESPPDEALTVLYSGHMGRMHEVATLVEALCDLSRPATSTTTSVPPRRLRFVIQSDGPGAEELRVSLPEIALRPGGFSGRLPGGTAAHVTLEFLGSLPTADWAALMRSARIALVTMRAGAERVVMPSKTYSAMLAGQAVLALCPYPSDLAATVLADRAGWVVVPDSCPPPPPPPAADPNRLFTGAHGLLACLEHLLLHPETVAAARAQATRESHARYRHEAVTRVWKTLLESPPPS